MISSDNGCISLLILLDLSAAFDTIDHSILLHRLEHMIGIKDSALAWLRSYLTGRYQFVHAHNEASCHTEVKYGVPQGSVLGPLLFSLYMLPLGSVIRKHGITFYSYADDTQLYLSMKPNDCTPVTKLVACLSDIKNWMTNNFLCLNSDKTEVMLIGPKNLTNTTPSSELT